MREYRLRKFQATDDETQFRMVFSKFYKATEIAMKVAQEDAGNDTVLQWTETSKDFFESQTTSTTYDIKTITLEE
jgi:hypothetical protein